jgi:DNA-binding GntR family transcriptional regulator
LSRLATSGLVTAEGQRGFRVASASIAEITDISMVRKEIEGLALSLSIEHGDDNWEAELVAARHRLALLEKGSSKDVEDEEVWEARHREFHTALISACHSPWLLRIAGLVNDQFDRYRRLAVDNSLSGTPTSLEHQKIMEAALRRDAGGAINLFQEHIDDARQLIVKSGAEFTDR